MRLLMMGLLPLLILSCFIINSAAMDRHKQENLDTYEPVFTTIGMIGGAIVGTFCPPLGVAITAFTAIGSMLMNIGKTNNKEKTDDSAKILNALNMSFEEQKKQLENLEFIVNASFEEQRLMLKEHTVLLTGIMHSLSKFEHEVKQSFIDLKIHVSDSQLEISTVTEMNVLFDAMSDVMKSPTHDTISAFLDKYKGNRPRSIISGFVSYAMSRTSPLRIATESNVMESRNFMRYYGGMLSVLVNKGLSIESFYFGLSNFTEEETNKFENDLSESMQKKIKQFYNLVVEEVPVKRELYWPHLVFETVSKNWVYNSAEKTAEAISQALNGIYCKDIFTVIVYKRSADLLEVDTPPSFGIGRDASQPAQLPYPLTEFISKDFYQAEWPSFNVVHEKTASFVEYRDYNLCAVVLRTQNITDRNETKSRIRTELSKFASRLGWMEKTMTTDLLFGRFGQDPIVPVLNEFPDLITGIQYKKEAYNLPIVRYTNNATSIMEENEIISSSVRYVFSGA